MIQMVNWISKSPLDYEIEWRKRKGKRGLLVVRERMALWSLLLEADPNREEIIAAGWYPSRELDSKQKGIFLQRNTFLWRNMSFLPKKETNGPNTAPVIILSTRAEPSNRTTKQRSHADWTIDNECYQTRAVQLQNVASTLYLQGVYQGTNSYIHIVRIKNLFFAILDNNFTCRTCKNFSKISKNLKICPVESLLSFHQWPKLCSSKVIHSETQILDL